MSRRNVSVATRTYTFSTAETEILSLRHWAVISVKVVDEMTATGPQVPVEISTEFPGLKGKSADDGIVGLVGRPWHAFPPLFSPSYDVEFELRAAGYMPHRQTVTVSSNQRSLITPAVAGTTIIDLSSNAGIQPGQILLMGPPDRQEMLEVFTIGPGPNEVTLAGGVADDHMIGDLVVADFFDTISLPPIELRREPVVLTGRVIMFDPASNATVPVAGAAVSIAEFWRRPIQAIGPTPLPDDPVVSLRPHLYASRDTTAEIRIEGVSPVLAEPKSLIELAERGTAELYLSNSQGLMIGDTLIIDADDPGRTEYIDVLDIGPAVSVFQPTTVALEHSLALSHRADVMVYKGLPGAIGPQKPLSVTASAGDSCVFVNNVSGITPGQLTARIFDGVAADEYHRAEIFEVTSDANGYYRFPPLSRVAEIHIHAERAPDVADVTFRPNYTVRENRLNISLN